MSAPHSIFTDIPGETWRDIPDQPGYQVSDCGRVRSDRKAGGRGGRNPGMWRVKKTSRHEFGYPLVSLCVDGAQATFPVHRLVLAVFVREPYQGECARHINNDPTDNRVVNLQWGTHADNMADKIGHGTVKGTRNPFSKLTDDDVREIRRLRAEGVSLRHLAKRFGVVKGTIVHITVGRGWSHVK